MSNALEQIRQQYPQYDKLSDRQLADALYGKFYAGKIDKPEYYAKLGMTVEDRSQWGAAEKINNLVNQTGTGAYKGIAGLLALPRTLSDLAGVDPNTPPQHPVAGRAMPGAAEYVKTLVSPRPNPGQKYLPTGADIMGMAERYLPGFKAAPAETTGDKLLQAGGMGASAVALPGSAPANFLGGVAGSEASELAGMATAGTKYEPYARFLASLVGGAAGVSGVNRVVSSSMEDTLNRALMGYSEADLANAAKLHADAMAAGSPLTAAEALAQVKGGNRQLMGLQRYAEQAPDSERRMSDFLSQRAPGNQAATATQLGNIAPKPSAPFEVGPTVQAAAQKSVNDVRQRINDLTSDSYRWGTDRLIPPAEFAPISESPVFQHYADKVRSDPLLGARVSGLDENSVAFVNQVKKLMDEDAANFSTYGTGQTSPERAMILDETQRPMVAAAKQASPLYEGALEQQAQMRRTQLEPMKRGATGQLAETPDWEGQAKIFMSDTPGSEKEVARAVQNIMKANPETGAMNVATLLRMKLEDMWNKAAPNVKGNAEEFRGANFASILEKNPQAMKSLEAAITALPNGQTQWAGFRNLLKIYDAQGYRLPAGSPTEFNRMTTQGLERGVFGDLKSLGRDMLGRWNLRRRTGELARVLTDPDGVALLNQLALLGPNSAKAAQMVQAFFQGNQDDERMPTVSVPRSGQLPAPAR